MLKKIFVIAPEDFGFARCTREDLRGGSPEENAAITRSILRSEKGHKRNAVLLNAGAALDTLERFIRRSHDNT